MRKRALRIHSSLPHRPNWRLFKYFDAAKGRCHPESRRPSATPNDLNLLGLLQTRGAGRTLLHHNSTLLNCLPGDCRMIPFISKSKSVARTSEEFNPEHSTMSSMCLGWSVLNRSEIFFSEEFSDAAANKVLCSASGCSACTSAARTGVGS